MTILRWNVFSGPSFGLIPLSYNNNYDLGYLNESFRRITTLFEYWSFKWKKRCPSGVVCFVHRLLLYIHRYTMYQVHIHWWVEVQPVYRLPYPPTGNDGGMNAEYQSTRTYTECIITISSRYVQTSPRDCNEIELQHRQWRESFLPAATSSHTHIRAVFMNESTGSSMMIYNMHAFVFHDGYSNKKKITINILL